MDELGFRSGRYYFICLIGCGTVVCISWAMAEMYHKAMALNVSAEGGLDPFFGFGFLVGMMLLGSCLGLAVGGLLCIAKQSRPWGALILLLSISFMATDSITNRSKPDVRSEAFHAAGERLMPLVHAIEAYKVDHGVYPDMLERLVPTHIAEIPGTGMGSYPTVEYRTPATGRVHGQNPYMLHIPAGYGMGFDEFFYVPNGLSPNYYPGGYPSPLGEWWYLHE